MSNYTKIDSCLGVVCGIKHQGKSYLIKNYLIPKFRELKPVIVLDVTGEYAADFPAFTYRNFWEFFEQSEGIEALKKGVHVIKFKENKTAILLINWLRKMEKPVTVIFEEAHMLFNHSEINKAVKNPLSELCYLSAHYGTDTILSTQRAANLDINVRSQADFFVTFRQKERADLEYLRQKQVAPDGVNKTIAKLKEKQFFTIAAAEDVPERFTELKPNKINQL